MSDLVYAKAKNLRVSPRKARLVADMIRGGKASDLSQKLFFVNNKSAGIVKKVLDSAIANAKNNSDLDVNKLIVKEVRIDEGFTLKRGKAVSKGRYHRILRRNSHITIGVEEAK